jgi:acyl-coenzyme A thioesterase PaaI-like protein
MATTVELQARLEALKAQRDSAVARVSYDGRTVEYRGTAEINSAIADLERELAALQGKAPVRQIRVYTSKGY